MGNMEIKQTKWEELSISNDFLFGKVMQNPKLCKELLQRILPDLNIERIEYPELQKSINMDMDARSVRRTCQADVMHARSATLLDSARSVMVFVFLYVHPEPELIHSCGPR